jgi:hypothetical protein
MTTAAYEGWALVEQMGFRRTIAKVCEVEQYGTKMLRLDVPFWNGGDEDRLSAPAGYSTLFAGGPSLYQVSPLDDELALSQARRQADPRPVRPVQYRLEDQRMQGDSAPAANDHDDYGAGEDE